MKKILFLLLVCMNMATFAKGKENLEFQCTLKNGAVVTIHSTKPDYIYRYTKNGKVELKIQQNKELVEKNSKENYNFRGNTINLFFTNGLYGYNVYSGSDFDQRYDFDTRYSRPLRYEGGINVYKKGDDKFLEFFVCTKINKFIPI